MTQEIASMIGYQQEIQAERAARAESLMADRGFLTLAGFYWLQPGRNRFGTDATNEIVLPSGSAPPYAGSFMLEGGEVVVQADGDSELKTDAGRPITTMTMQSDQTDSPDLIHVGRLSMLILQRGERYAVRLYDVEHPSRQAFSGLRWYDVDLNFRIPATFVAYGPPKMLPIVDAVGYAHEVASCGYVQFEWQGRSHRLDAQARGARLFYNFRDTTNGDSTYGAGRFLYSELPPSLAHKSGEGDNQLVLDFNRATNPFCAYTPYATCPLPPPDNRLDFRVEAGEMIYVGPVG